MKEIGEAKMWRGIISDSVASNQKPLKTSSPSPISPSSSLIKMMISPFRTLSSFLNQLHTKITHSLCSILKSMFPLLSGKICRNYSSRSEPENRLFQERLQVRIYFRFIVYLNISISLDLGLSKSNFSISS